MSERMKQIPNSHSIPIHLGSRYQHRRRRRRVIRCEKPHTRRRRFSSRRARPVRIRCKRVGRIVRVRIRGVCGGSRCRVFGMCICKGGDVRCLRGRIGMRGDRWSAFGRHRTKGKNLVNVWWVSCNRTQSVHKSKTQAVGPTHQQHTGPPTPPTSTVPRSVLP